MYVGHPGVPEAAQEGAGPVPLRGQVLRDQAVQEGAYVPPYVCLMKYYMFVCMCRRDIYIHIRDREKILFLYVCVLRE